MTSRGSAECPPRPFGGPGGLAPGLGEPPLDAQCVLPLRIRHLVAWLIVTQRGRSADYVVVEAAFLGARRPASPPAFANLLDATISLGFAHSTALAPWSDDAKLAALCGARPGHGNRPVEQTRIVFPSRARAAVPTDVMPLS